MRNKKCKLYYAVTPGGTLLLETESNSFEGAVKNLLEQASHMPYKNWHGFKKRGYTIAAVTGDDDA